MTPIQTVQHIYAAFGRGDVPAILACLAEDIEWEYGDVPNPVPWLQPRRGRAEVPRFFEALLGQAELPAFQPTAMFGDDKCVLVLVDAELVVRATGRRLPVRDEVHVWRFNDAGLVQRFAHRIDTWGHAMALRGGAPAGHVLQVLADRIEVLADGSGTAGAYEQFMLEGEAGNGPPPHRHAWDETYCVLDGEVDLMLDGATRRLGAGGYLRVPGGHVHTYHIASPRARVFVTTSGSGAASEFFAALDRELPPGPPELPRVVEIARRFGVEPVLD